MVASWKETYDSKLAPQEAIFSHINPGDRIFIHTACGEPQFLVHSLIDYVAKHPKAFFDAEVYHVWTLGLAPYTDQKFKRNFRHNSFFISDNTRDSINHGDADYTPLFLSQVPEMFRSGLTPVDVALVQVSPPDDHGYMSLGVSVDITKAAAEAARLVVAQVNRHMPRVHGNTFLHVSEVDYLVEHDEPLLEFAPTIPDDVAERIGRHVARIVEDGDTIQVGYGSTPNAIMKALVNKKDLGLHTELISDGLVDLIRRGVITNRYKSVNRGLSVASFCMGSRETYRFIHDNPAIQFLPIDYTNDPLLIARHERMVAINSALQIDLTGQATAESIGSSFFSGVGGQADFMRGAILAKRGKSILTMQSTALGGKQSRIVPRLPEGAGVTLARGDIHYVVTEYGIAYLHGKNVRERAMALIAISHPKFRPWLIEKAKEARLIYQDQAFVPGKKGEYPEELEVYRTTRSGVQLLFRPVKISDEPLLKDFFYSLSDQSLYRRFISERRDMPHERLQDFVVIDYSREMIILAVVHEGGKELIVGMGQYGMHPDMHSAEVALVVRDDWQGKGIGTELLDYLTLLAKKRGLLGFTAEVLMSNQPMLHIFEKAGFDISRRASGGVYELKMAFRDNTERGKP